MQGCSDIAHGQREEHSPEAGRCLGKPPTTQDFEATNAEDTFKYNQLTASKKQLAEEENSLPILKGLQTQGYDHG